MKILFLCSELAGYFINCIQLLQRQDDVIVKLVCYPVIEDAPFLFDTKGIEVYQKNSMSRSDLLRISFDFNPDLMYVAGWSDRDYFFVTRHLKARGTMIVCGMDNPWTGSIRQRIA